MQKIEAMMPSDTPAYMLPAWLGCMSWAIGTPEIVQAFRDDSGFQWKPGRSGIERMIDSATGADRQFIEAFIRWANVNVWGPIDLPPAPEEPT